MKCPCGALVCVSPNRENTRIKTSILTNILSCARVTHRKGACEP